MTDTIETLVVGAGVIGLAIARELASQGHEVLLLEKNATIGQETSSRNSEVIHAGIYYPTGSLKAQLCVTGKKLLYQYCESHPVSCSQIGKLIVATQKSQVAQLQNYQQQAIINGVTDLVWLTADQVLQLEPKLSAVAGLYSPSTGIVDSHEYMLSLLGDFEREGGLFARQADVNQLCVTSDNVFEVSTADGDLVCQKLVVAAGHHSAKLAKGLNISPPDNYYAIGHYYSYAGEAPFQHLVYPVAEGGGLGVHVTLDQGGQARFGPDVRWIDCLDYTFDDSRREEFIQAIQAYFPGLEGHRLQPGYTGIRPKISGPNEVAADFRIDDQSVHGVPGLVALYGIESPGITASLAIAEKVARRVNV